jgi:hypothetical protein
MPDREDLSPEERAGLERLPREQSPPRALEDRVVMALRREGLLHAPAPLRLPLTPRWIAAAAAACFALFAGGFLLGGWTESRHTSSLLVTMHEKEAANAANAAAEVQRTGSAYVAALSALASFADTTHSENLQQGREVAVNALHAAANELVRLAPEDPVAVKILQGMSSQRGQQTQNAAAGRRTVWY